MAAAKHTHTIHIDAPVETVFRYVEDPAHMFTGMEAGVTLGEVHRAPEGAVSSYEAKYHELGMHMTATFTREAYVVNERIVDHSSQGPVFTLTVAPDGAGTMLTFAWDASALDKMLDAVFFHGDKDVERAIISFKREIEALT